MISDCCEKTTTRDTLLKRVLSSLKCRCDRFQKNFTDLDLSIQLEPIDEHKNSIQKSVQEYFQVLNQALGNSKQEYQFKTRGYELDLTILKDCLLLTQLQRKFLKKAIQLQDYAKKLILFVCSNLQKQLFNNFIFIFAAIIEEFLITDKVPTVSLLNSKIKEIEAYMEIKFDVFAKQLKNIYPIQRVPESKRGKVQFQLKKLISSWVRPVVTSFEGHYELNPKK